MTFNGNRDLQVEMIPLIEETQPHSPLSDARVTIIISVELNWSN